MSRLFGRSDDVYSISKYLLEEKLKEYKRDNTPTTLDSIVNCPSKIELYLPNNAIEIINGRDIVLSKSVLAREPLIYVPIENNVSPNIFFPIGKPKEEYKLDTMFFIGRVLATHSLDYLPKEFDIACEYHDVLPLLMEYLYLKECGREDELFSKNARDLIQNARRFIKIYGLYQKYIDAKRESDIFIRDDRSDRIEEANKQAMLKKILVNLVPLASLDATLQITDELKSHDEYKRLIEELIENPNHDREKILKNKGYDTYGFKRLRKEIDLNRRRG